MKVPLLVNDFLDVQHCQAKPLAARAENAVLLLRQLLLGRGRTHNFRIDGRVLHRLVLRFVHPINRLTSPTRSAAVNGFAT